MKIKSFKRGVNMREDVIQWMTWTYSEEKNSKNWQSSEKQLNNLAQWSTEVENRMDVRSTPIGNTRSSSSPSVLVSSTD